MRITSIAAHSMTAKGICLGAELGPDIGLGHVSRAIHIGPITLVTSARNDDKTAWLEAVDAAEKLVVAAQDLARWALAQAEAADDLKVQRETVAQARRVADFGDLTSLGTPRNDSMDSADPYSAAFAFGAGR